MAAYCFASPDERRNLYIDSYMRGYLVGCADWPHQTKTQDDAFAMCEELRREVCCIAEYDSAYRSLVLSAWISGYLSLHALTPREAIVMGIADVKHVPIEEALRAARARLAHDEDMLRKVNAIYAQHLAAMVGTVGAV